MSKIKYKITDQFVNVGDTIVTNEGFRLTFSMNLFNDNPHMFEIVKEPKFKTVDNVDIYVDDGFYLLHDEAQTREDIVHDFCSEHVDYINTYSNCNWLFFSTKESAYKYLMSRLIQKYENKINIYPMFKYNHPKVFWRMVLKEIADDLNGDWKPSNTNEHFFIYKELYVDHKIKSQIKVKKHNSVVYDLIYFKTAGKARKAIDIMGSNIEMVV